MLDFETYLARHGESAIQALIECIERYEGVRSNVEVSLEARWAALMQTVSIQAAA